MTNNANLDMVLNGEPPRLLGTQTATGEERGETRGDVINDANEVKPQGPSGVDTNISKTLPLGFMKKTNIATWNVRTMDLGKLEVVKMEMDERNISILGLSESRWTGKGFFQSDKHRVMFSGTENDREK